MFLRKIIASLALAFGLTVTAAAQPVVQTEISFYRSAAVPIAGTTGTAWAFPGAALSASTHVIWGVFQPTLAYARLVVAWTPGSAFTKSGVRLVSADFGPTNIAAVCAFERTGTTPVVDACDVTAALQALITEYDGIAGPSAFVLGLQMRGTGSVAAKVYSAVIEVVWR